jgi:hypothetical protein
VATETWACSSVAQRLLSMHKTLGSISSTKQTKEVARVWSCRILLWKLNLIRCKYLRRLFSFVWCWGFNSGLHTCEVCKPCLQPLLPYFILSCLGDVTVSARKGRSTHLFPLELSSRQTLNEMTVYTCCW